MTLRTCKIWLFKNTEEAAYKRTIKSQNKIHSAIITIGIDYIYIIRGIIKEQVE